MDKQFNIVSLFFDSAQKHPEKIAIIDRDKKITFSEFEQQVKDTSTYFISKGIQKGDRVMLFVPMSIDLYRIVLALFNIGATAVFLDEWVNKKRMEECCKVAQCNAFIGILKARIFALFSSELRNIPIKLGVHYSITSPPQHPKIDVYKSDTALITFTTGSTGTPKAAKRTHGFLHEQFTALLDQIDPQPEDIDMPALPIVLLINLAAGCTSVITKFKSNKPELMDARKILAQIDEHKITRMVASPFFIKQLATYSTHHNLLPISSLKKIFTGGAPVFPAEAKLYLAAFPQAQIQIVYGSTEAEPISSINALDLIKEQETSLQNGLKVGMPHHKTQVRIIEIKEASIVCVNEDELGMITLRPGEIGEIIVSGPHVLREYFNNEEALKRNKIIIGNNCWHRTGDSGYMDETGMLYLTGRCNALIHSGGKLIAPFIYENFFQSIKGVEMGTIIQLQKKLLVIIEARKAANKEEIQHQIQGIDLAFDEIKFVTRMPRDLRHHSKIDYEKLKSTLC